MFGQPFGHGIIRKMVVLFGTIFNNIHVQRFDANKNLVQTQKVPINYGPREKFLARLEGNPDLDRDVAIQLPRMAFEITNIYYDASRKVQQLTKIKGCPTSPGNAPYTYAPVPYNIDFNLYIMTKNIEDGTYIVEQILPFFAPEWRITALLNEELDLKYDIPIGLNQVNQEDTYAGDFITRRAIIWTLNFTMKTWMFGPTIAGGKPIHQIEVNLSNDSSFNSNTSLEHILVTPGQDANNNPVSWYGSPDAAIRPDVIPANNVIQSLEYGFMVDITSET